MWANGMLQVETALVPTADVRDPGEWAYAVVLRGANGVPFDQSVWLLLPFRELALPPPKLTIRQLEDRWLEVSSQVYCHAVHVEDHGHETVSDNWFDLLPGVPVRVRVAVGISSADISLEAILPRSRSSV